MSEAYPKRTPHYDRTFLRELITRGAANVVGCDGFALLAAVVLKEDEQRYRGPVDFWNSQLVTALGVKSEDTLERVRKRCVGAGWLHYTPGSRSRPARYWVNIPSEGATESGFEHPQTCGSSDEHPQNCGTSDAPTTAPVRAFARSMCGTSLPDPNPKDIAASAAVPKAVERKAKTPKKPRPRIPLFDAIAEATGADPVVNGSHIGKVASLLSKADPPYTPDDVREFAARWRALLPSWASKEPRLTPGIIEKHIYTLRATTPRAEPEPPRGTVDDIRTDDIEIAGAAW